MLLPGGVFGRPQVDEPHRLALTAEFTRIRQRRIRRPVAPMPRRVDDQRDGQPMIVSPPIRHFRVKQGPYGVILPRK